VVTVASGSGRLVSAVGDLLWEHPRETVYRLSAPCRCLFFCLHERSDRRTHLNTGFLGAAPFLGLSHPESGVNRRVVLGGGAFGIIPRFPSCRRVRLGSSSVIFAKYCSGVTSPRRRLFFSRRAFFGAVDIEIPFVCTNDGGWSDFTDREHRDYSQFLRVRSQPP